MSFFKNLFLNSDTVSKVVESGLAAGDKLFYTEEEREEGRQKVRDWYLDLLASMKPFNVAMRLLAVGVFSMWAFHLVLSTIAYMAGVLMCSGGEEACLIVDLAFQLESQMDKHINSHFGTIIMFYFGAAGINSAIAAAKGGK